ncbi:hypothetical protein HNP02_006419 [Mycobacterium sp. AZCC_0083]|nr:hypothetical protein [Mycobacterium sp. AZCC_0083]
MIDRASLVWCLKDLGREAMTRIAIDEWASSSPLYTKRMQRALRYEDNDVATIFKGFQLDIGSPPQYMDFRFTVADRWHGEFQVNDCGGLNDFEPLGEEMVIGMCHTVEDPTFDATAVATNPKAQLRPIHRPPRPAADRNKPPCAWTVIIDESYPETQPHPGLATIAAKHAARVELASIDDTDEGLSDYSGPLLSDLDFGAFSKSALVRMADEVCVQMHLLSLAFGHSVQSFTDAETARDVRTRSLIGIAGLAAKRIRHALNMAADIDGAAQVVELHPLINPSAYVNADVNSAELTVYRSDAHRDDAWISLCTPADPRPLQAIVTAVDAHLDVRMYGDDQDWTAVIVRNDVPAPVMAEVSIAEISSGAHFEFQSRQSIPLTMI